MVALILRSPVSDREVKSRRAIRLRRYRHVSAALSDLVTPSKLSKWDRRPILQLLAFTAASFAIHSVAIFPIFSFSPNSIVKVEKQRIEVAVIEKAPEPVAPETPKIVEPKAKPKPKIEQKAPEPPPEETKLPPPPVEEASVETSPPPVFISGISMSSTSASGSFSVGVGNTLAGKPAEQAANPDEIKPYKAKEYAPIQNLSELPAYLENLSKSEIDAEYPVMARKTGREAMVLTKLTIDDDGSVVKIAIVEDPGFGFAEAAKNLAKRMKFKPAMVNGRAVATEVTFPIVFELEQ